MVVRTGVRAAMGTIGCALACAAALIAPPPARAEAVTTDCAHLASTIQSVGKGAGGGAGETIVLEGMCNEATLGDTSGIEMPEGSAFTLEGKPGTVSGLEGSKSVTGPLLFVHKGGAITLSNLTLQKATHRAATFEAAAETLVGDTFAEDSVEANGFGGAVYMLSGDGSVPCPTAAPAVTITKSTFKDDRLTGEFEWGGAVMVIQDCMEDPMVVSEDLFEDDEIVVTEGGRGVGGGLTVASSGPSALQQRANVFTDNRVADGTAGKSGDYGGGGEFLEGVNLTSVGDIFSNNEIAGTQGAGTQGKHWSWGGGIGILSCLEGEPTHSTLEDAAIVSNGIEGGEGAEDGGAGLYVGCKNDSPNYVTLLDSTVTRNGVPAGGVAGIDGDPTDGLTLGNTIVAKDTGGAEIAGFSGEGGSIGATFSDVCAAGGTSPLAGEGNICADPLLAGESTPFSADAHETAASPTIDAGSNALVPAGLTSDLYGGPRIVAGTLLGTCGSPPFVLGPARVDIGAAEAPAGTRIGPVPACAPPTPTSTPTPSVLNLPRISQGIFGRLSAVFAALAAGRLRLVATFPFTHKVSRRVHGHRRLVKVTETITYARAETVATAAGNVTLHLTPKGRALSILRSRHHLRLTLTLTFTEPGHTTTTRTESITVVYKAPKHSHHR